MTRRLVTLPAFLACFLSGTASANLEFDGKIGFGFNDNISNAVSDRDIFEDSLVNAEFNAGKLWVPAVGRSLLLSGHLGVERYNDSTGLDRNSYGASLTYIHRLGLGAYAPRIKASLRSDWRDFDTARRDGWLTRAGLTFEKRFTPALHAALSLARETRHADAGKTVPYSPLFGSDVFNQDNNEFSAAVDYTLPNNSMLTARYLFRDGEIDASTNPGSVFFGFSKAIARDYGLCRACNNYVVYLVDASVHSLLLDWNVAVGRDTSVSASVERRVADTGGGVTYTGNVLRIQLNRRF